MDNKGEKVLIKVNSINKSPQPNALKSKLDLSQIANHPLVQNRSPEVVKISEQSVLRSRTNSQVVAQVAKLDDNNNKAGDVNGESRTNNPPLRIRRSTSMSYTSTLRKRRLLSPGDASGGGMNDVEFPSPKPNVQLSNFSISPYSNRALSRRLSLKEQDQS